MTKLPVSEIKVGDILQVNEGDTVPLDGTILEGQAAIDESMLTGESIPLEKNKGQQVIGASIVKNGNFKMQVKATGLFAIPTYHIITKEGNFYFLGDGSNRDVFGEFNALLTQ